MKRDRVIEFARENGYDGAVFRGKWKHFDVYEPTSNGEEPANIGRQEFILEFDGMIRMTMEDEAFEYIDSLPDEK